MKKTQKHSVIIGFTIVWTLWIGFVCIGCGGHNDNSDAYVDAHQTASFSEKTTEPRRISQIRREPTKRPISKSGFETPRRNEPSFDRLRFEKESSRIEDLRRRDQSKNSERSFREFNNRPIPFQAFKEWDEIGSFFSDHGLKRMRYEGVKMEFSTIFQGKWEESEKRDLESIIGSKSVWEENLKTEIMKEMGSCGVKITDLNDRHADAVVSGSLHAFFNGKKVAFFRSGSILANLHLEIRSINDDEIVATIDICDEEDF